MYLLRSRIVIIHYIKILYNFYVMDYKELQTELRILFNDDTAKIILKEDYEDIQKIKSYEYETKKK